MSIVNPVTPKDFTTIFSTKVGKENTGNTGLYKLKILTLI